MFAPAPAVISSLKLWWFESMRADYSRPAQVSSRNSLNPDALQSTPVAATAPVAAVAAQRRRWCHTADTARRQTLHATRADGSGWQAMAAAERAAGGQVERVLMEAGCRTSVHSLSNRSRPHATATAMLTAAAMPRSHRATPNNAGAACGTAHMFPPPAALQAHH